MKESEYIIATNRAKISIALHAIVDTLADDEYGISDDERNDLIQKLSNIEIRLFDKIIIE